MILLSDQQLEQVAAWMSAQNMSHQELEEELLDHICTSIEHMMEEGQPFEESFDTTLGGFGDAGLKGVEDATIHLLTYQSTLMKRITMAAGMLTISFLLITFSGFTQSIPNLSPIVGDIEVTSAFGMRIHPKTKKNQMHRGVDFRADIGTEVVATANGKILIAGVDPERPAYGIMILMEHADGYTTMFAHLSEVTVEAGAVVEQGTVVGKVGSSGVSMGPHLHYEVMRNDTVVDPAEFIPQ